MNMMPKRSRSRTRMVNYKKLIIITLFLIILFTFSVYTVGNTFAWFQDSLEVGSSGGESAEIIAEMDFQVNTQQFGIPGATQPITTVNKIIRLDESKNFIYKYEVEIDTNTIKNVEKLGLSKNKINELGLIEYGSISTNDKIIKIYYGKQEVEIIDLGDIFFKFKEVSEYNINDNLDVTARLHVTQIDRNAFMDNFNITEAEMNRFEVFFN